MTSVLNWTGINVYRDMVRGRGVCGGGGGRQAGRRRRRACTLRWRKGRRCGWARCYAAPEGRPSCERAASTRGTPAVRQTPPAARRPRHRHPAAGEHPGDSVWEGVFMDRVRTGGWGVGARREQREGVGAGLRPPLLYTQKHESKHTTHTSNAHTHAHSPPLQQHKHTHAACKQCNPPVRRWASFHAGQILELDSDKELRSGQGDGSVVVAEANGTCKHNLEARAEGGGGSKGGASAGLAGWAASGRREGQRRAGRRWLERRLGLAAGRPPLMRAGPTPNIPQRCTST
jgi:hypothetical protein